MRFFSFVVAAESCARLLMKEFHTLGALNDKRGAMAHRVQFAPHKYTSVQL
jgi:hypothetical protein